MSAPSEENVLPTEEVAPIESGESAAVEASPAVANTLVEETAAEAAAAAETVAEPLEEESALPAEEQEDVPLSEEEVAMLENQKYLVLDGAPVLMRDEGEANILRGALELGSAGKDVCLHGRLVLSEAGLVLPDGIPFVGVGTSAVGEIPFQASESGALSGVKPTEEGHFLSLQKDAEGHLVPSWRSFDLSTFAPVRHSLFARKSGELVIPRETLTVVSGWRSDEGHFHDSVGFDAATGVWVVPDTVTRPTAFAIDFQATLQNDSTSGATTVAISVDEVAVSEQTYRPGTTKNYPYSGSVRANPVLIAGNVVKITVWHDSAAPVTVLGEIPTVLAIRQD